MRIAYLYDLPVTVADDWSCKKVFVDNPKSNRADLSALVDSKGLHKGDVLVICKMSQLGQGRKSQMVQEQIAEIGATIEVIELPAPKKPAKRKGWLVPTDEQVARLKPLWQSVQPAHYVLQRAEDIMGQPVNLAWMNRWIGRRKPKKTD